jgi:hypothetical protein
MLGAIGKLCLLSVVVTRKRRLALARLNKPHRLLLELKRVPSPLCFRHLGYPFALEQSAKGYVFGGKVTLDNVTITSQLETGKRMPTMGGG